jgi:predicted nuclease of predicted toxin-antitoxin system
VRFLIDEMFPPSTCASMAKHGHDAVHVRHRGLDARPDPEVAALARQERRILVTENVKDFAREQDLVVVCVLKSRLRQRSMAQHLAATLDAWAAAHPRPYLGLHWPEG